MEKEVPSNQLLNLCVILVLLLGSCEKAQLMRTYDEVVIESPLKASGQNPHALMGNFGNEQTPAMPTASDQMPVENVSSAISWTTPDGWMEQKENGMRLATFKNKNADSIECSIVNLEGKAGDLESNVMRWMKQINFSFQSDTQLQEFISRQAQLKTSSGLSYQVIDFTTLQTTSETASTSMISAILETDTATIFVKLTGTKSDVLQNKKQFLSLCNSITVKQ